MSEQRPATPGMDGGIREPQVAVEAEALLEKAQALRDAGELAAALNESDQALQVAPQWAEAYNLRGVILDEMGRTDEAIAAYKQALRLDPAFGDAAVNLADVQAERRRPPARWKRIVAIALPLLVALVVVVTVAALQAERGPDWKLTVNEYIAQSALRDETVSLQKVATARRPENFNPAMGTAAPSSWTWQSISPPFPPLAVQCVLLERSGTTGAGAQGERRQVVYVAYHNDGLYHVGWLVYEAQQAPFTAQLLADLAALGCDLGLE